MFLVKSNDEIYPALEKAFSQTTAPMTCVDLMDDPEVFSVAMRRWDNDKVKATEKLSDTLAFMWRKGVIDRFPAPHNTRSMARYAYAMKNAPVEEVEPIPYSPPSTRHKGDLAIIEKDGEVILEFEKFTIVVKAK